ncbi:conserved hypothetical protein [delta proteobacterium NaphS2]|nr:conserved hypothetical protein [delta proteobacterium NaphS2]
MRAYLLDEINRENIQKIVEFLKENTSRSTMEQIFWVKFPEDLLSPLQFRHTGCQPHFFAVEVGPDWIKLEFFVRSLETMKCDCAGYCTDAQRDHIIKFADGMLDKLSINT